MKIGDYVRSKNGEIGRCVDKASIIIEIEFQDGIKSAVLLEVKEDKIKIAFGLEIEEYKFSSNVLDLVEYGDLIKFKEPIEVFDIKSEENLKIFFTEPEFCNGSMNFEGDECIVYTHDYLVDVKESDKVEWIMTYEQVQKGKYNISKIN